MTPHSVHSSTERLLAPARTPDVYPEVATRAKTAVNCPLLSPAAFSCRTVEAEIAHSHAIDSAQIPSGEMLRTIEYP